MLKNLILGTGPSGKQELFFLNSKFYELLSLPKLVVL